MGPELMGVLLPSACGTIWNVSSPVCLGATHLSVDFEQKDCCEFEVVKDLRTGQSMVLRPS